MFMKRERKASENNHLMRMKQSLKMQSKMCQGNDDIDDKNTNKIYNFSISMHINHKNIFHIDGTLLCHCVDMLFTASKASVRK